MRKTYRAISIGLLLSFLFNTAVYDSGAYQSVVTNSISNQMKIDELAVGSMCNEILGLANKDRGDLMLALETSLIHFARGNETINTDKLLECAGEYRGSIFDNTHFFFSEKNDLSDGYVSVKCRIKDEKPRKGSKKPLQRTYHAVFSTKRDENAGFDIKIYTEEEWTKNEVSSEDTKAVKRYVEHNRKIDKFIADRIAEGNFTEFENRAKKIGWDGEEGYRDRKKPKKYLPERVWEYIKAEGVETLLEGFDTNLYKALENKNIVFIRVPEAAELPVIREADRVISVTTHASRNAVYVFLGKKVFNELYSLPLKAPQDKQKVLSEYLRIRGTIHGKVIGELLHAIGKAHNFKIFYSKRKGKIQNALDIAWDKFLEVKKKYLGNMDPEEEINTGLSKAFKKSAEVLMKKYPDLKKLKDGPADLDTNLRTRVYGGGYVSKRNITLFLYNHTFTKNELERIIEMYEKEDWNNEYSEKWDSIRNRLTTFIVALRVKLNNKKKLKTYPNGWPRLDSIGGIRTLYTALAMKQGSICYESVEKKEAIFEPLPPGELKRAALLERDMKSVLKDMLGMGSNFILPEGKVDFYAKRLEIINDMRKLNRVKMRRNPSVFDSQPYDNIFDFSGITWKTLAERNPILIPCSSRMPDGKEKKYSILLDFSVSEQKIIVTTLTEEEANAVKRSKKYIKSFKRNAEDRRIMDSYLEHEDKIDAVIDSAIREKRYMRIQPEKSSILDKITGELTELFQAVTGKKDEQYYKKLAKKIVGETYTIINVGEAKDLPRVRIELTNGVREEITVRMHTGARGKYIFLTNEEYESLYEYNDKISTDELWRKIECWIVHDAGGVGFGLPLRKVYEARAMNYLDYVYASWIGSKERSEKFVYDENSYPRIKKILNSDNPIVDIDELWGYNAARELYYRDYAAGNLAKIGKWFFPETTQALQKKKTEFIRETSSFTTDELKRLEDAYGEEQSYKRAREALKQNLRNEEYGKYQAAFVRLRETLEKVGINVKVISHKDLRPRIDKIGGIETLEEALSLRNEMESLIDKTTWDKNKKEAEFKSLPDEELKTVVLLKKDIQKTLIYKGLKVFKIFYEKKIIDYAVGDDKKKDKLLEIMKKYRLIKDCSSFLSMLNEMLRIDPKGMLSALFEQKKEIVKDRSGTNTFDFSKMKITSNNEMWFIPCFRSGNEGLSEKQYYAMVDFRQEENVDIQILTQEETDLVKKIDELGIVTYIRRSAEDRKLIQEYQEHEARIDGPIYDAFKSNRYHAIPKNFSLLKETTDELMNIFNKITGKTGAAHEKLVKKIKSPPHTLINVGDVSNLPRIEVEIKGKNKTATVRMHTGARGKYIFLTNEEFNSFYRDGDVETFNKIEKKIKNWMIHDAGGVSLGLPLVGVDDDENVMNELDYAYKGLDFDGEPTLKKILESDNPIVDINKLKGTNAAGKHYTRDYLAGNVISRIEQSTNVLELETFLKVYDYGDKVRYTAEEIRVVSGPGPDLASVKPIRSQLNNNDSLEYVRDFMKKRIKYLYEKDKIETIAKKTGRICAPPESNFTLFVLNDFVTGSRKDRNSEYGKDIIDYGSRFGIKRISTDKPDKIVDGILYDIKEEYLKPKNVVVQLPRVFAEEKEKYLSEIERLRKQAPGIRFMIVDFTRIKEKGTPEEKIKYRRGIYSIMCLVGKMGRCRETSDETQVEGCLKYLLNFFYIQNTEYEDIDVEKYISVFSSNDIQAIVDIILSCMPITPFPSPDYDEVVHIFTFA